MLDSWMCVNFTLPASNPRSLLSPLTPLPCLTRCVCSVTPITTAGWVVYYYLIAARRLPSGFKMNVSSCFPVLIISLLFWLRLLLSHLVRFAAHAVASWWWWSSFGGEYFTGDPANSFLKFSEDAVKKSSTLQSRWQGGNSVVSHFVGLYCRFYFAKTGLDVSDKLVHIHPNCSPVDSVIGRCT